MVAAIRNIVLRPLGRVPWDRAVASVGGLFSRKLRAQMEGFATDAFLELLLGGMDLLFEISSSLRAETRCFEATYVFRTESGEVAATAVFSKGNMRVLRRAHEHPTVVVIFKRPSALRAFLFSRDQDILESLLRNEVRLEGNINYIYKFGYMAREIQRRLGLTVPTAASGAPA